MMSKKTVRTYDEETKVQAVKLAKEIGTQKAAVQLKEAKEKIRFLEKENKRIQEENEFLGEAAAFFAAGRQKLAKTKG